MNEDPLMETGHDDINVKEEPVEPDFGHDYDTEPDFGHDYDTKPNYNGDYGDNIGDGVDESLFVEENLIIVKEEVADGSHGDQDYKGRRIRSKDEVLAKKREQYQLNREIHVQKQRERYYANRELYVQRQRERYRAKKESGIEKQKEPCKDNKEENLQKQRERYQRSRDELLQKQRERYQLNRDEALQKQRERYQRNKDETLQKRRERYQLKREEHLEKQRERYRAKKGLAIEKRKERYQENKDEICLKRKEYYQSNRDEECLKRKEYYQNNRDEALQKQRERYQLNREEHLRKQRERYRAKRDEHCQRGREYYQRNKVDIIRQKVEYRKRVPQRKWNVKSKEELDEVSKLGTEGQMDPGDNVDLPSCLDLANNNNEKTKFDPSTVQSQVVTFPEGYTLTGKFAQKADLPFADCFVAMAMGIDEETVEVRHLFNKNRMSLKDLQLLLHAVMAVVDMELKEMFCLRYSGNPFQLKHSKSSKLISKFTKEILSKPELVPPEMPKAVCNYAKSRETLFIAEDVAIVPHHQLIPNQSLSPIDTASVGAQIIKDGRVFIAPLFAVNAHDWKWQMENFFSVLLAWIGDREKLKEFAFGTPCGAFARDSVHYELQMECFDAAGEPKQTFLCPHCGKNFQIHPFLTDDYASYRKHVNLHDKMKQTKCSICGEEFRSHKQRMFHERTHNPEHVKCPFSAKCTFVGLTQKSIDEHGKWYHTASICEQCGKEFTTAGGLDLHRKSVHGNEQYPCPKCGVKFNAKYSLSRHLKRHENPNSVVNRPLTGIKRKANKETCVKPKANNARPEALVCNLCGKIFMGKELLARHQESTCQGNQRKEDIAKKEEIEHDGCNNESMAYPLLFA